MMIVPVKASPLYIYYILIGMNHAPTSYFRGYSFQKALFDINTTLYNNRSIFTSSREVRRLTQHRSRSSIKRIFKEDEAFLA